MPRKAKPKVPVKTRNGKKVKDIAKKEINWDVVGKKLEAQCQATGIAEQIGISVDTLYRRCEEDLGIKFTAFKQQKRESGKELLREKQFQIAMGGDKTMLVWLGKQYLGQVDKKEQKNINSPEPSQIIVNSEKTKKILGKILDA